MTRDVVAALAALDIPDPIAITEGALERGLGLGELALVAELVGLESLDDVMQPGRLPVAKQLRLRQALMWVRVRRLRDSPDPELRALADTPFDRTDSWLPVLAVVPDGNGNGHGPPNPSTPAARPPRARSRGKS
jgi:hypothetical protein